MHRLIAEIVSNLTSLKRGLQTVKRRTVTRLQELAARREIFAMIYFSTIDKALGREAKAVVAGHRRYAADHARLSTSYFLLRRNVHRLEKGLIMQPRRSSFASEYILETVHIYKRALDAWRNVGSEPTAELTWAKDVLSEYFGVVERDNQAIDRAWRQFQDLEGPTAAPNGPLAIPYRRDLSSPSPVSIDDFLALSKRRRSVRWFTAKPVPREIIEKAIAAAGQAPSACNRQPFVFRLFDDAELVSKVVSIPMGTAGFAHQVPAVAVIVGRLRAYPFARDRHAIYIDGSLAAMSFVFALETMGIASCVINWADQQPHEARIQHALNLESDERVLMMVAFGWPDPEGMVPFSAKKSHDELRAYNEWSGGA